MLEDGDVDDGTLGELAVSYPNLRDNGKLACLVDSALVRRGAEAYSAIYL